VRISHAGSARPTTTRSNDSSGWSPCRHSCASAGHWSGRSTRSARLNAANIVTDRVVTDTRTTTAMARSATAAGATYRIALPSERHARARAGFRSPVLDEWRFGPYAMSRWSVTAALARP
jgi:hypothetical protein